MMALMSIGARTRVTSPLVTRDMSSKSLTRLVIWLTWREMTSLVCLMSCGIEPLDGQELGRRCDGRQRIAQLVGEHRQELVLAAVGLLELFLGLLAFVDVAIEDRQPAIQGRIGAHLQPGGLVAAMVGRYSTEAPLPVSMTW